MPLNISTPLKQHIRSRDGALVVESKVKDSDEKKISPTYSKGIKLLTQKNKVSLEETFNNLLLLTRQELQNISALIVVHAISNLDLKIQSRRKRSGQKHSISL
jgi:hypothetical protein